MEQDRSGGLERKIGQQAQEVDCLPRALQHCRGPAPAAGRLYRRAIYEHIQREVQAGTRLRVMRMCELTQVSPAGYYRFLRGAPPQPEAVELRDQIQQIALQWPAYGSRRITAELQRRGWQINRKQRVSGSGRRPRPYRRLSLTHLDNEERLHSAFNYRPPAEYDCRPQSRRGASMSFQRHGEIYPYDEGTPHSDRAPAHRLDESLAGYSWRVLRHGPLPFHEPAQCCKPKPMVFNAKAANSKP
jgi:hypothetical protein